MGLHVWLEYATADGVVVHADAAAFLEIPWAC